MEENDRAIYEFGAFRFHAAERVLFRGADVVPLTPKVADTLLALLAHRGRVVEKSELIRVIWPDTFVEEGGLARNISVLRKTLGDEPDGSQYIETIPKRGYRFVAPVREVASAPQCDTAGGGPADPGARRAAIPPTSARRGTKAGIAAGVLLAASLGYLAYSRKSHESVAGLRLGSVAVLPLKNLSADAAQEYFSQGMTDTLATELAKTGVRVIASSSIRRLRQGASIDEIGKQLKVDAVVQGTVLGSDDRVRINAQLVEVRTGRLVWADSYQRSLRDVLALQAEVTGAIAREILASVAPQKLPLRQSRAVVPEAYRDYLKGRFFWNKRTEAGLRKAIEYFDEAIAKDSTYAPAHAGVADAYALLGSNGYDAMPPGEAMPRAKTAALEALALDNGLAEAHTSLAYVLMGYDWDLPAAGKEFQEALRSNAGYATAHHWYGHYLLATGQPQQALSEMKEALALDPLSLPVNVGVGWCFYFVRRYDEAIGQYRKTLELEPDFALAHQALGMALEQKGAFAEAIVEFRKAVALSGGSASAVASLGYASARAGATSDARAQLAQLSELSRRKYVPAIYMSLIYLGLGDRNSAAPWFAKARGERSEYLIYHRLDPGFDAIRADKRFALALPVPKRDR